jgi:hypothetical protein
MTISRLEGRTGTTTTTGSLGGAGRVGGAERNVNNRDKQGFFSRFNLNISGSVTSANLTLCHSVTRMSRPTVVIFKTPIHMVLADYRLSETEGTAAFHALQLVSYFNRLYPFTTRRVTPVLYFNANRPVAVGRS